nr:F-box/kelch-repeat protein At3g06240-like [Tanacetum cinerariifolium]
MCCIDRRRECQVVGSSNGLVCISLNNKDFLVVNPSTRKVKELRNAPEAYRVSGFSFDSSIDDYKVVIGFRNEHSKSYVFEVLTLKSNVWRSVYIESGYDILLGNGVLCNGAIHWASYRNNKKVIVSFHLSKESRRESFASHNSDGGSAKSKRQSHICSDDDGRGVERKRRERERERD